MPQHVRVVTLTVVEHAWNGYECPTRFTQQESIISFLALSVEIYTFKASPSKCQCIVGGLYVTDIAKDGGLHMFTHGTIEYTVVQRKTANYYTLTYCALLLFPMV